MRLLLAIAMLSVATAAAPQASHPQERQQDRWNLADLYASAEAWNADATKGFGVAFDYRGLKDVSERSAFLIDGNGVIRGSWRYETSQLPDFDILLEAVRAIA